MTPATADLYLRLSLDREGATAIERQEAECRRWCDAHGVTVRTVHVDRGVSGYRADVRRNGFETALSAVREQQVSTLVVWRLDRLSRRGIGQVGEVLEQFERAGARLVSVKDNLDTQQPQARMIIALLSEFARAESETMGVRIRSAKEAQRARGEWLSGKPPFGYAIARDRKLVPVEPAASMVREVFTMIIDGHPLKHIARHLNDRGFRSSRGGLWRDSALSAGLSTPAYAGLTPARHATEKGTHAPGSPDVYRDLDTGEEVSCLTPGAKPIVSRAVQLEAQAALLTRLQYAGSNIPKRPPYALLLQNLGRCGSCDRGLVTHGGYQCNVIDREGVQVCTAPTYASVAAVDRHVTIAWIDLLTAAGPASDALRQQVIQRWIPSHNSDQLTYDRLRVKRADLLARVGDADDAYYRRGDLDAARHSRLVARMDTGITELTPEDPNHPRRRRRVCAKGPSLGRAPLGRRNPRGPASPPSLGLERGKSTKGRRPGWQLRSRPDHVRTGGRRAGRRRARDGGAVRSLQVLAGGGLRTEDGGRLIARK